MAIDIDTARKVAKLARIRVEEAALPDLARELSGILGFMEQLNEVDVDGIEPMTSVTPMRLKRRGSEEWFSHAQRFFTCTSCSTLSPEPMGGACVKTKTGRFGCAASSASNH